MLEIFSFAKMSKFIVAAFVLFALLSIHTNIVYGQEPNPQDYSEAKELYCKQCQADCPELRAQQTNDCSDDSSTSKFRLQCFCQSVYDSGSKSIKCLNMSLSEARQRSANKTEGHPSITRAFARSHSRAHLQ